MTKRQIYISFFNQLPDGYRELAIANLQKYGGDIEKEPTPTSIPEAIGGGFLWSNTPEGIDFWHNLSKAYQNFKLPEIVKEPTTFTGRQLLHEMTRQVAFGGRESAPVMLSCVDGEDTCQSYYWVEGVTYEDGKIIIHGKAD